MVSVASANAARTESTLSWSVWILFSVIMCAYCTEIFQESLRESNITKFNGIFILSNYYQIFLVYQFIIIICAN